MEKVYSTSRGWILNLEGLKSRVAAKDPTAAYGLLAVAVVALIQLFFSLRSGGYFIEQWYWGASAVAVALLGAALVPGYLSSAGRKQWALAGTLIVLTAVVTASIFWSISPVLSFHEASRTAMYAGAFVLLLPAAVRWGSLVEDATIFGALLPAAIFGLLQKILPTSVVYSGFATLETDPRASSTVGYHPTFGMMCAMGALLAISRVGAFRSLISTPLRALYSAAGTIFLVALYFSFSRGAVLALGAGAVVFLLLSKYKFEALGNLAISGLPALWVVSQARELPGIVSRPVSLQVMENDGLALVEPLMRGVVLAFLAQIAFSLLLRAVERFVPEAVRNGLRLAGTVIVGGAMVAGLVLGAAALQRMGGVEELKAQVTSATSGPEASEISRDQTQRLTSVSAENRIELWKIAWANFREHPLTGTGGDTYQIVYEQERPLDSEDVLHPHSMWMSLLSDTGIFAFLAFAVFSVGCLGLAFYNALFKQRSRRSRALIAGCAAALTAYLASSSIDWNWYIPASTLPFFVLAAVAAGTTPRRRKKRSAARSDASGASSSHPNRPELPLTSERPR